MKAERFTSYVEELRQFASTYGMHCGVLEDLHGLVAGLEDDESFRDECGAMLRSIVYRERGKFPPSELLTLAAIAWGGPTIEDAAEGFQEPIRHLLRFVSGVMNPSRASVPASRDLDIASFIVEPAETIEASPNRTPRPVALSAVPVRVLNAAPSRPQAADVDWEIARLERESADVMRYLELLRRRAGAEEALTHIAFEQPPADVGLQAKLLFTPGAEVSVSQEAAAVGQYDPWDERSELQRELRRFAAEREARLAAERAVRTAETLQARLVRRTEAVLSRLVGAITP